MIIIFRMAYKLNKQYALYNFGLDFSLRIWPNHPRVRILRYLFIFKFYFFVFDCAVSALTYGLFLRGGRWLQRSPLQLRCTSFSLREAAALGRAGSVALTPRFCRCTCSACIKAFNPHSLVSPSQGGMERSPILFTHWLCISEKIVIPSSLNQCSHLKIGAMQSQWED